MLKNILYRQAVRDEKTGYAITAFYVTEENNGFLVFIEHCKKEKTFFEKYFCSRELALEYTIDLYRTEVVKLKLGSDK